MSWYHLFSHTQNGRVRRYAAALVLGAVLIIAIMLYLGVASNALNNNLSINPIVRVWSMVR